jgi:hypothetical protein
VDGALGAADVSAGLAAAGAASVVAAGLLSEDDTGGTEVGAALPPLKSVTYQPDPLSWNPAAVNCLVNAAFPHWGQSCKGASDIFCKTSLANPQDSHL